jgi:hypothetical protein
MRSFRESVEAGEDIRLVPECHRRRASADTARPVTAVTEDNLLCRLPFGWPFFWPFPCDGGAIGGPSRKGWEE